MFLFLRGFEEVMSHPSYKTLFFFTPLIAAMAGNVGVQSSAIIVQGLANDIVKGSLISRLLKELGLSLINGIILGVLTIIFGLIIDLPLDLSITISLSMLCVIIVAALIGTSIPIILEKRGIDPAIATGPFITTSNDIFGIFLFFYIAKIILGFLKMQILHLDSNHPLLADELEKIGFKNHFDLESSKSEVEKKKYQIILE